MATDSAAFEDVFYTAPDGLRLHARIYGTNAGDAWPVICLPGLTRNVRDFHELAIELSGDPERPRQVVAFDYRGRGQSQYDPDWHNYQIPVEAADIVAGLIALGIEYGAFIGTSRGGLIIHVLAAIRPSVLKAVVLNDVGPVLDGEGLAHIRAYLERAPKPNSLLEAVAIQRAAHGTAFPALQDADWERMVGALYRMEGEKPVNDFDPKLLNILKSFDLSSPLPELWPQFEGLAGIPLLAIRGENSKLLSAATLAEMARRHPGCRTLIVEGQGHAPLLETAGLPGIIGDFIARAEKKAQG
jgi:pimeloyl-ACP methyl ester carboxylesterase